MPAPAPVPVTIACAPQNVTVDLLRTAVIVNAPAAGARVGLGSAVSVSIDGDEQVLTIVGASESDPARGRISSASPVGRALLGREAGDDVVVAPAGERVFRVLSVA